MSAPQAYRFLRLMSENWHLVDITKIPETDQIILNEIATDQREEELQAELSSLRLSL